MPHSRLPPCAIACRGGGNIIPVLHLKKDDDHTNLRNSKGVTPPPTPRIRKLNSMIHVTGSEEDEPYMVLENTVQSRSKQAKRNNFGVDQLCTPCTNVCSDPFVSNPHPAPPHTPSKLKIGRMRSNTRNPQNPSREIIASTFHRSSFENMSLWQ